MDNQPFVPLPLEYHRHPGGSMDRFSCKSCIIDHHTAVIKNEGCYRNPFENIDPKVSNIVFIIRETSECSFFIHVSFTCILSPIWRMIIEFGEARFIRMHSCQKTKVLVLTSLEDLIDCRPNFFFARKVRHHTKIYLEIAGPIYPIMGIDLYMDIRLRQGM